MKIIGHFYRINAPRRFAVRVGYIAFPCVEFALATFVYSMERVRMSEVPGLLRYRPTGFENTIITGPAPLP